MKKTGIITATIFCIIICIFIYQEYSLKNAIITFIVYSVLMIIANLSEKRGKIK